MNKVILVSLAACLAVLITGCASEKKMTPIVMSFDVSAVDFSKLESMKHATICDSHRSHNGDLTLISAAKAAGIKRMIYAEQLHKMTRDPLGAPIDGADCLTVYGE